MCYWSLSGIGYKTHESCFEIFSDCSQWLITTQKNRGRCYDNGGNDKFACLCEFPHAGVKCEIDFPVACDGNPCQNDGTCKAKAQPKNTQVCFKVNLISQL